MKDFLKTMKGKCKTRNIPVISDATEDFLRILLEAKKPKCCLEVGGAVGYSSIWMAQILRQRKGSLYSSEISYPAYLEAIKNICKSGLRNLTFYPFDFIQIALEKLVSDSVDFIFIDGQKNQYAQYLEKIESIISEKTLVVLDDVIKYHNKLTGLYEYLTKKQIFYKILQLEEDDGVMIIGDIQNLDLKF